MTAGIRLLQPKAMECETDQSLSVGGREASHEDPVTTEARLRRYFRISVIERVVVACDNTRTLHSHQVNIAVKILTHSKSILKLHVHSFSGRFMHAAIRN